jgi:frataxin
MPPVLFRRLISAPKLINGAPAPPSSHSSNYVNNAIATATGAMSCLCEHSTRFYSASNILRHINVNFLLTSFESNDILIHPRKSMYMQQQQASSTFISNVMSLQTRKFQSVGEYHDVADQTLHYIQDGVEDFLEEYYDAGENDNEEVPEVNYASGVLTIYLPPHGTYVINKQTPNQQIWWSSPISGPRRYEYDEKTKRWMNSRAVDLSSEEDAIYVEEDTLGGILNKEFRELFGRSIIGLDKV